MVLIRLCKGEKLHIFSFPLGSFKGTGCGHLRNAAAKAKKALLLSFVALGLTHHECSFSTDVLEEMPEVLLPL